MAVEYKDYYEILGVSRSAGEDDIRRAFRRLARVYHPDKTGNDQKAEDRFKDVNEAYEVLGDSGKRKRYDDFQVAWQSNPSVDEAWKNFSDSAPSTGHDPSRTEHFTFSGAGFSEFFDELFGRRAGASRSASNSTSKSEAPSEEQAGRDADDKGDDLESDIRVSLEEAANGAIRSITMRRAVRCPVCHGVGKLDAHSCKECGGKGDSIRAETYKVKIPKGIQPGAFLRIPGRGEEGINGAPAGDLYLKVCYGPHPEFRVENGHLIHDLEVAPWEAVLGAAVQVPTLSGPATIRVPAGTRSGGKLRIKGRGLPSADGSPGDLILNVKLQVPEKSGPAEQRLWQELARESAYNPRDN